MLYQNGHIMLLANRAHPVCWGAVPPEAFCLLRQ